MTVNQAVIQGAGYSTMSVSQNGRKDEDLTIHRQNIESHQPSRREHQYERPKHIRDYVRLDFGRSPVLLRAVWLPDEYWRTDAPFRMVSSGRRPILPGRAGNPAPGDPPGC